jgi:hypothetical protein
MPQLRGNEPILGLNMKEKSISSKVSYLVLLRSLVPIVWKISSRKVTSVTLLNSILFKPLRHPLCILTSKLSFPNIKLFFSPLRAFLLLMVFMIIPFPLFLAVSLPMFALIATPLPKRMKLRK